MRIMLDENLATPAIWVGCMFRNVGARDVGATKLRAWIQGHLSQS